jgi:hypothetical protein
MFTLQLAGPPNTRQEVSLMRIRSVLKHSAQALAEGSLIALLVVGLMAGSVFAAKGGNGGKPGGGGGATLVAACPCTVTAPISFSGSGYDTNRPIAMLSFNGATTQTAVSASGTISHSWPYFTVAGTYWVRAYQSGNGGKMVLKAETYVTVE